MRLFALAAAVPLLMASATLARSPLRRGETTDTCANLNANLAFPDVEVDGKPYVAGHIHVGLCISRVKTFVSHSNVTTAAIKVVGEAKVELAITDMIKQTGVQCAYPPHARPSVTKHNACAFVCVDGFWGMPQYQPSSCICPPHLTECNGQCGDFHSNCTTMAPPSRRKNDPKCAQGRTLCGVPRATSGAAFQCTDVTCDSYTCGGCIKASPVGSSSTVGVNCHALPGVEEVSCADGTCVVHRCKSDFTLSASNDGCVADPNGKRARALPAPGTHHLLDNVGVPADVVDPKDTKVIAS
ncbi:hypothetical protein V8E55_008393 [Tylopilus felleus]